MCIRRKGVNDKVEYREDLLRSIEASHGRLVNAVNTFNLKEATIPINKADLESFPFMTWHSLNDFIQIRKRGNRFDGYLCFDTKMKKGGAFGEHFHDDIIESCEIITGEMLDAYDGRVYLPGMVAHYEKGEKHIPIALKDTMLHVLFKT